MEKFPSFSACRERTEKLIEEKNVLVFSGNLCFNYFNCFRIVMTIPEDKIKEACGRIESFYKSNFLIFAERPRQMSFIATRAGLFCLNRNSR